VFGCHHRTDEVVKININGLYKITYSKLGILKFKFYDLLLQLKGLLKLFMIHILLK